MSSIVFCYGCFHVSTRGSIIIIVGIAESVETRATELRLGSSRGPGVKHILCVPVIKE